MRKYSPFFEFENKQIKEYFVSEKLIESLNKNQNYKLHSLKVAAKDPPDCVCLNENNELIAIEVVELVCEKSANLNSKGDEVYRIWNRKNLIIKIKELLRKKDLKKYKGGPHKELIVCIHTDESDLSFQKVTNSLLNFSFGSFNQINSAFLIFSYSPNPNEDDYPVLKISINKM